MKSPDWDSRVPKGLGYWIVFGLDFHPALFFNCAKIKDFSIPEQLSFPHFFLRKLLDSSRFHLIDFTLKKPILPMEKLNILTSSGFGTFL
jgi:hypothetical protein